MRAGVDRNIECRSREKEDYFRTANLKGAVKVSFLGCLHSTWSATGNTKRIVRPHVPARVDTVPRSDTNAESRIGGIEESSLQAKGGNSKGATEDTA